MEDKSIADAPLGAFCNTFDLHQVIIGFENQFSVFLREVILHRVYCRLTLDKQVTTHLFNVSLSQCYSFQNAKNARLAFV